jgi:hypothetical protein
VSADSVAVAAVVSGGFLSALSIGLVFFGGVLDRRHARQLSFNDRSQDRLEATYLAMGQYIFTMDGRLANLSEGKPLVQPLDLTPDYYRERDAQAVRVNYLASPQVSACWGLWAGSVQEFLDHYATATPEERRADYLATAKARDIVTGQVRGELASGHLSRAFEQSRWWHRLPGFRRRHRPPPAEVAAHFAARGGD